MSETQGEGLSERARITITWVGLIAASVLFIAGAATLINFVDSFDQ